MGCAFWLASSLLSRGQMARGGGWVGRAQRLVQDHGLDCVEQGFLLIPLALRALEEAIPHRLTTRSQPRSPSVNGSVKPTS